MPTKNELLNAFEEAIHTWSNPDYAFTECEFIGRRLCERLNELSWVLEGDQERFDKHETWLAFQRLKKECGK